MDERERKQKIFICKAQAPLFTLKLILFLKRRVNDTNYYFVFDFNISYPIFIRFSDQKNSEAIKID